MKILVVTQYFWPENFRINDLCEGLSARGHDVTVYTGLPNYPTGDFFQGYSFRSGPYKETLGKIKIIRSPLIPRGKNKNIKLIANYFSFAFVASLLAPFLVREKYDVIFVHEPSPVTVGVPAIVLKKLKDIPIFFWVQDLWPESLEATNTVKNKKVLSMVASFVRWIYKHCDKVLITSPGFADKVKLLGVGEEKIIYFPQWAEALYLNEPKPDFNDPLIPTDGFKVMFAGNIGSAQDFETIVQAAIILREHKNITFLILGDGLMRSWAEEQVRVKGVEKNFIFLGRKPVTMMPDYFSKADVMLMSLTDSEIFSITIPAKLQSYLAVGKPVIASANGISAEIVEQWKSGVSCPASTPEKLAGVILKMSTLRKEELSQMGRNAFACYQENFMREKLISKLENEFKKYESIHHRS